jgi:hypothetical protein
MADKPLAHVEPNQRGLLAARAASRWYLGDSSWAEILINAYLNPDAALAAVRNEKES